MAKHYRATLQCATHVEPIALDVNVIVEPAFSTVPSYRLDCRQTRVLRAIATHRARYACAANLSYVVHSHSTSGG